MINLLDTSENLPERVSLSFVRDKAPRHSDRVLMDNLIYLLVMSLSQLSAGTLQL